MNNPAPTPAPLPPPPSSGGGCGCCAGGCLSLFAIAVAGLALVLCVTWFAYVKTLNTFTADAPIAVQMEPPSEVQFAAASQKFEELRSAAAAKQSATVELTAADLNTLIARHPKFRDWRGKVRVAIEDSTMTLDLSVPLHDVPLPRAERRWFNGTVRFGLNYDEDRFALAVKSLEANGRQLDLKLFDFMAGALNEGFNEGFDKSQRRDRDSNEFWENVKSISVVDDKLIITTKGAGATVEAGATI